MSKRLRGSAAPVVKQENQRVSLARGRKSSLDANSSSPEVNHAGSNDQIAQSNSHTDNSVANDMFLALCDHPLHLDIPPIELRQNAATKWDRLPAETRAKICKVATRLVLMKGIQFISNVVGSLQIILCMPYLSVLV